MQEWYLGWEKVSCLERCPQFRSVLGGERESNKFGVVQAHRTSLNPLKTHYVSATPQQPFV